MREAAAGALRRAARGARRRAGVVRYNARRSGAAWTLDSAASGRWRGRADRTNPGNDLCWGVAPGVGLDAAFVGRRPRPLNDRRGLGGGLAILGADGLQPTRDNLHRRDRRRRHGLCTKLSLLLLIVPIPRFWCYGVLPGRLEQCGAVGHRPRQLDAGYASGVASGIVAGAGGGAGAGVGRHRAAVLGAWRCGGLHRRGRFSVAESSHGRGDGRQPLPCDAVVFTTG